MPDLIINPELKKELLTVSDERFNEAQREILCQVYCESYQQSEDWTSFQSPRVAELINQFRGNIPGIIAPLMGKAIRDELKAMHQRHLTFAGRLLMRSYRDTGCDPIPELADIAMSEAPSVDSPAQIMQPEKKKAEETYSDEQLLCIYAFVNDAFYNKNFVVNKKNYDTLIKKLKEIQNHTNSGLTPQYIKEGVETDIGHADIRTYVSKDLPRTLFRSDDYDITDSGKTFTFYPVVQTLQIKLTTKHDDQPEVYTGLIDLIAQQYTIPTQPSSRRAANAAPSNPVEKPRIKRTRHQRKDEDQEEKQSLPVQPSTGGKYRPPLKKARPEDVLPHDPALAASPVCTSPQNTSSNTSANEDSEPESTLPQAVTTSAPSMSDSVFPMSNMSQSLSFWRPVIAVPTVDREMLNKDLTKPQARIYILNLCLTHEIYRAEPSVFRSYSSQIPLDIDGLANHLNTMLYQGHLLYDANFDFFKAVLREHINNIQRMSHTDILEELNHLNLLAEAFTSGLWR